MAWSLKDESYLDKNGIISSSRSLDLPIPTDAFELYHKFSSEESNKITPVHVNLVSILSWDVSVDPWGRFALIKTAMRCTFACFRPSLVLLLSTTFFFSIRLTL
jgi:hypothetical protein